jgi:hypothetical protein
VTARSDGEPSSTATWIYCLARGTAPPDLDSAPAGVPGAGRPRAIAAGPGLWLVAATAPLPDYGQTAIERDLADLDWVGARAMAHEAVIEHVADATPVIPLKLFTLFHDDARAVAELSRRRDEIERAFARVAGRREWDVRVHLDASRAASGIETAPEGTSGRDYLRRKQVQRELPRRVATQARAAAERLLDALAPWAEATVRKIDRPAGTLVLHAALLVPDDRRDAFERAVEDESRRVGGEAPVSVTLSGPFPPYSFVGAEASAGEPPGSGR